MLQKIRQHAHGWLAWLIIGAIGFVFVIWGISADVGDLFGRNANNPVIQQVGSQAVTQAQLDAKYRDVLDEYKASLAAQHQTFTAEDDKKLKDMIQEQLVMELVLNQFLAKSGFFVSKLQADSYISRIPQLQEDGRFSMERYQSLLQQRHQSPSDFLDEVSERMMFAQASAAIGGSALVLPYQMDEAVALIYQTRDVGYAVIESKDYEKHVTITDTDLQAYYNGHHSEFTTPVQVTVDYMTLSREQIATALRKEPVPEDALKALYEAHADEYTIPESRRVSHILIAVPEGSTDTERMAKKKEAEELLERLRAGASFAAFAKQYSQDPGSAAHDGELGVVTKGMFDPAFDEAVFSAPKGQVVGPVETAFGYHLILVTNIEPQQKEPLDKVRQALSDEWYADETAKRYDADMKDLADQAFQAGTDLTELSKQFHLTLQTATLTQGEQLTAGVFAHKAVLDAAFDKSAYEQKLNSELIPLSDDEAVVLRTTAYTESHLEPFDSVKVQLETAALARQTLRMAEDKAALLEKALLAGTSPEEATKTLALVWKSVTKLDRRDRTLPLEIMTAAFKTPMGDKPAFVTVPTITGVAVIAVNAIYPGQPPVFQNADEAKAFNENLRSQLGEFLARRDFDLFAQYAKKMLIKDKN